MVLRPGDPAPTDFDPDDAERLKGRMEQVGTTILGDETPSEALALGAFARMIENLPTYTLESVQALLGAELTARGRPG